jgi:hypothetical protein
VEEKARTFTRWKEVLWPLGGAVLGLVVMPEAITQYPGFFNENRWLLPTSTGIVILCFIVPLLIHENAVRILAWAWSHGQVARVAVVITIFALIAGIIFGSHMLFRVHNAHLTSLLQPKSVQGFGVSPQGAQAEPAQLAPMTVKSLFSSDFPEFYKSAISGSVVFEDGERVQIKTQEYEDFQGKSSFIVFYIPETSKTARVCTRLANSVPGELKTIETDRDASVTTDGFETSTHLRDLVFSGRVYVYHETPLSLKQKSDLTEYFKRRHLDVQFRGWGYLQGQIWGQALRNKNAK